MRRPPLLRIAAVLIAATSATAGHAATTTRTLPAGAPPWTGGEASPRGAVAFLPVQVVVPLGMPEEWLPREEMDRLARELTAAIGASAHEPRPVDPALAELPGAPRLYLGCTLDEIDECDVEAHEMVLAVTGGTKRWRAAAAEALEAADASALVVPALTVSEHWLSQRNWRGGKEIPLGAGHAQPVPWLTSLETTVPVMQITAVVVGADGKVVRWGAEGLLGIRTRFRESVVGVGRLMQAEDVARVRTELRRSDLEGEPLVWRAALDALLVQLLGAPEAPAR